MKTPGFGTAVPWLVEVVGAVEVVDVEGTVETVGEVEAVVVEDEFVTDVRATYPAMPATTIIIRMITAEILPMARDFNAPA